MLRALTETPVNAGSKIRFGKLLGVVINMS
jgi:hypothetical protein